MSSACSTLGYTTQLTSVASARPRPSLTADCLSPWKQPDGRAVSVVALSDLVATLQCHLWDAELDMLAVAVQQVLPLHRNRALAQGCVGAVTVLAEGRCCKTACCTVELGRLTPAGPQGHSHAGEVESVERGTLWNCG